MRKADLSLRFGKAYAGVMTYQRAFMRKFDDWVVRNLQSPLGTLSDAEVMELSDDICEELRIEFKLDPETHTAFKKMVKEVILRGRGNTK